MKKCKSLLDMLVVKHEEVMTGTFYPNCPKALTDYGIKFKYDIVDERDSSYAKMLENIKTTQSVCTIKTNDMCGYKDLAYVVTQDSRLWQISGVIERLVRPHNKQALRLMKKTADTEYVIRLIGVDNPKGLK